MEVVKVNLNSPIYGLKEVDFRAIYEEDEKLLIVFKERENHRLSKGQTMTFRRYVYNESGRCEEFIANVEILDLTTKTIGSVEYDAVYTTTVGRKPLFLAESNVQEVELDGKIYTFGESAVTYCSAATEYSKYDYYVIKFSEDHNIFPQDVDALKTAGKEYKINVQDANGGDIGQIIVEGVPHSLINTPITTADTVSSWTIETCNKFDAYGVPYDVKYNQYFYTRDTFSRNKLIISSACTVALTASEEQSLRNLADDEVLRRKMNILLSRAKFFTPYYNEYYYGSMDEMSNKNCILWTDLWWNNMNQQGELPSREVWLTNGNSRCILGAHDDYWRIPIGAFSSDNLVLGSESDLSGSYVDERIDSYIPPVIDMERLKYSPVIDGKPATSITFDFHFRKRAQEIEEETNVDSSGRKKVSIGDVGEDIVSVKYREGWYIDPDSGQTQWWNGMDYNGELFNKEAFEEFLGESGHTSDLLGYLGFTDDDVYFRKSKLSKSFVRLSFYSSPDPIEQKLLYYSTIFLDGTGLYGKYMKQYTYLFDKGVKGQIVFCDDNAVSARLDTQIVLTDEYTTSKSSEGFNLYLFADDVTAENSSRTIYMKVEFNHAGNGKTIPMILWPKNIMNGEYCGLETENFIKSLYIPVNIQYLNGRYTYSLPTAENEGENITLVLFEPKLDCEYNIVKSRDQWMF